MRQLAVLILGPLLLASAPAADDAAARVRLAAAKYAETAHGAVLFRVATQTDIRGGPIHRIEQSDAVYVANDGLVVRKRYLHFKQNGRELGAEDLAEKSAEAETALSRFGLRLPYLRSVAADYRFDPPVERAASVEIGFHALVRDQSHGDGTIVLDRATDRVERVDVTPAVMPPKATGGTVSVIFGLVAQDRWDIVEIDHDFSGREGFLRGKLRSATHYDHYMPYPDQARALAALAAADG